MKLEKLKMEKLVKWRGKRKYIFKTLLLHEFESGENY